MTGEYKDIANSGRSIHQFSIPVHSVRGQQDAEAYINSLVYHQMNSVI